MFCYFLYPFCSIIPVCGIFPPKKGHFFLFLGVGNPRRRRPSNLHFLQFWRRKKGGRGGGMWKASEKLRPLLHLSSPLPFLHTQRREKSEDFPVLFVWEKYVRDLFFVPANQCRIRQNASFFGQLTPLPICGHNPIRHPFPIPPHSST